MDPTSHFIFKRFKWFTSTCDRVCLKDLSRSEPSHNPSSPPRSQLPFTFNFNCNENNISSCSLTQYCLSQGPFFLCTCSRLLPASVTRHSPCPPTLKPHPSQSHILVKREKRKNRDCSRTKPAKTYA